MVLPGAVTANQCGSLMTHWRLWNRFSMLKTACRPSGCCGAVCGAFFWGAWSVTSDSPRDQAERRSSLNFYGVLCVSTSSQLSAHVPLPPAHYKCACRICGSFFLYYMCSQLLFCALLRFDIAGGPCSQWAP